MVDFERLLEHGMISEGDLGIFTFASDPETAWSALRRREVEVDRAFSSPEQIGKPPSL